MGKCGEVREINFPFRPNPQFNVFGYAVYFFKFSTPNVAPVKEHTDNSNTTASEFNPAYSVEITDAKTQSEVDTFDHILQVTSHHEAVVAYYYMDDDNKVDR